MNLFNLLESPNLGAPSNRPGAQDAGDQHSPSPIGSGTSKREAKKKPVTMMGVGVRESKIVEVWEPITESLRDGEYYTFRVFFDDGSDETLNFSSDDIDWDRVGAKRGKQVVDVKRQGGIQGSQSDSPRKPHDFPDDRGLAKAQRAYDKQLPEGVTEASFTAAASMNAANRKQSGGKTAQPTHGIKVGDQVTTRDGKEGQVTFVDGDTVHVKGTNHYYPDKIKHYSAKDLKKGVAEGLNDFVKGIKRKIAGKEDPTDVQDRYARAARREIGDANKYNNPAANRDSDQAVKRYNKVNKVVNKEGVAEGMFGIDPAIKGKIQNITMDLSEVPGYWDHEQQTFTDMGLAKLKATLKKPEYIKYALNLTADDYDADLNEAGPFSYGAKKPRKGSVADLAAKKRKEQERGKRLIEPKDQMVGTARVVKDVSEGVTSPEIKQAYADIMKTKPRTPKRKAAVKKYQALRADTLEKKKQGVAEASGISKNKETQFHARLDKLVHNTFGKRKGEMEEGSVQDKLHKRHQELRKKSGLPDPDYYKELRATYDLPDEERYAKAAELKKKYNVKEDILDRAAPKLPKPRNPAEKILTAKRTSGAAGKHVNKKRQTQLQPKHRGRDELDESLKSKLAGAALAGALATGATAGNLPDLVGKVTMDVNGQQVTKEFNLGNDYASPMAAQRDLEKFLQSKGINNFYIQLERAAPDNKFQPQDTRPGPYGARSVAGPGGVADTAGQVSRDVEGGNWRGAAEKAYKTYQQNKNADLGAVGRGEFKDRIIKGVVGGLGLDEDLNEEMEQYLYQLDAAGYDILAEAEAIKGADGKRCWKGKRYAGTKNGRDICIDVNEEKKGLYYYVNQRKEKGISRPKNHPKAPSAQDWKDAAKTAKK